MKDTDDDDDDDDDDEGLDVQDPTPLGVDDVQNGGVFPASTRGVKLY